jgi:FkbM family methyltransferase
MKELLKKFLRTVVGLDLVKFPPASHMDIDLKNFFTVQNIDLVLDVGAFDGLFCKTLRERVGYKGRVVSFEPCAATFAKLSRNLADDPMWTGYPYGLGREDRTAVLNTFKKGEFNSVHPLHTHDAHIFDVGAANCETIQLRSLDNVWNSVVKGATRVFLKIDTQGHDTEVMLGAKRHLSSIIGILSELPVIEIYEGIPSMGETLKFFKESSYRPIGFYPVNFGYDGEVAEFDVLFVRGNREVSL